MKNVLGSLVCASLLVSCGVKQATSASKITNGTIIAETDYPSAVNLFRRILDKNGNYQGGATCTASWIGEDTLITAAHCLGDDASDATGKVGGLQLIVFEITDHTTDPKATKGITTAVEAYRNKKWEEKKGFNRYDLAIIKTAPMVAGERARPVFKISRAEPTKGEAIQIVGYGFNNMSTFGKKGDDLKRIGNNVIDEVKDGFLNLVGETKDKSGGATGENSSAGNGDSGGPMLHNGELIGVASGGGQGGLFARGEASYVDLNSAESKEFLARFGF